MHWVLYNLPASSIGLAEGVAPRRYPEASPRDERLAQDRLGRPVPAESGRHRYFFKLYALDAALPASLGAATKSALEKAMHGRVLASATLVGTYQKQR